MYEDETPIAWTAMPTNAGVVGVDGSDIGTAETTLGDREEDIFHGIVLRRGDGVLVEVPAARVKKMTDRHVVTDLTESDTRSLPGYHPR